MKEYIKKYWLLFIIITQPILDIIAYFTFNENVTFISFVIRTFYLAFIIIYTFIKSKNKKKYILYMLPFIIFSVLHLLNTCRTSGFNLFKDLRYIINVMQFPIVTICLIDYLKWNTNQIKKVEKGIVIAYIIIFISVILSVITNSYVTTYEDYGITGWFKSANTQSMILTVLSPLCLYYCSKKNNYIYILSVVMVFLLLFFNGTRACYYTLILSFIVMLYILFINKSKNKIKILITVFAFLSCFIFYKNSFMSNRGNLVDENTKKQEEISQIGDNLSKEESIVILNSSNLFKQAIQDFGEDKVYNYMKDKITAYNLTDNRLLKRMYGKIIFDESDTLTKLFGINHKIIDDYGKDLENDFTALFYYYGYIGFGLYMLFILYFAYMGIKTMIIKPIKIVSPKFIILTFTILLSLFGAQYSGALLRKSNANIYLSLVFALYYIYLICSEKNENIKIKVKDNKISFLLLHLGYGGIESSTINTANSLCDRYDIEIMSFYKLDKNQTNKINEKIKIKYLFNGSPNKEKFMDAWYKHQFIKIFEEGLKSVNILIKKKILVIKYIINCDSKYIISTRYDFSVLLSKYGNNYSTKIAQEHHYHNNNKKYINILKNKYYNIDYLFALTKTLEKDYKEFLVKNKHTKVILVPNMLYDIPNKVSKLNTKNIITISRLDYGKRNDDIVLAFSKLKEKDWKLYIVGDGNEFDNLTKLVKKLKLEDRVILAGYKSKEEIEEYMLKSSLFLMASETEGLPMVLLEAMSYGIPCIAYETASGVNDIIDNDKNGYIIKNRNEEEYVEKIEKVITNQKLRDKLGKNAKEKVNDFSKEKIVTIWQKVLK